MPKLAYIKYWVSYNLEIVVVHIAIFMKFWWIVKPHMWVVCVDSTHLKANMAVCEQWSLHFNDGGLLVSTNQLDGCSTNTLRLLCQSMSNTNFRWIENFGQGVKCTVHITQKNQRDHELKKIEKNTEKLAKSLTWANVRGKIIADNTIQCEWCLLNVAWHCWLTVLSRWQTAPHVGCPRYRHCLDSLWVSHSGWPVMSPHWLVSPSPPAQTPSVDKQNNADYLFIK